MPHRHRRQTPELVRLDVEVGAADAGAANLEQHLAGAGCAFLPLGDADVPGARRELGETLHRLRERRGRPVADLLGRQAEGRA